MDWLRRAWRGLGSPKPAEGPQAPGGLETPGPADPGEAEEPSQAGRGVSDAIVVEAPLPSGTERSAPGVAAFFEGVAEDGGHAILDLGPGSESSFRLYSRYATRIRFAGLLPDPPRGRRLASTLDGLPPPSGGLYDLVLAWNLLDRLTPEEHGTLMDRLAELTAPQSRLYVLVDTSEEPMAPPLRFKVLDRGRVAHYPSGPPAVTRPPLLPAEVERTLSPFEVEHAFTLRKGLREYVAVRG